MKKKIGLIGLLTVMATLVLVGCGSDSAKNSKTEVSLLIGKEEIAKELDETIAKYNDSQEKYEVKVLPLAGQNANEKLTSLYASKNAPVMVNAGVYNDLAQWEDKFLDLTGLPLLKGIDEQYLEAGQANGKQLGVPTTIEAFGYLYNKDILDEAVGGTFDPKTISTRTEFSAVMKKIDGLDNKKSIEVSPMDWSLGAHFSNLLFTNQSADAGERKAFMADMVDGKVELLKNNTYKEFISTFDLMKEHNAAKEAPLSTDYDATTLGIATGEIGFWFMGNWAYPQIMAANPEARIGIMPVPMSDEKNQYGNSQISIGVPQTWAIDGTQSTKEEQAGAKDFLNWLYEDKTGQEYYVNKMGFIPISSSNKIEPKDELSKDVLKYLQDGESLEWMNAHYPPTAFPAMGASLQKYLDDKLDSKELAKEIENYWANSSK